jgi:class 3 adenylate cyclase
MPDTTESIAILFVDICDSTELYDLRGDDDARRLIDGCLTGLTGHVAAQGGTVIKTMGDGLMSTFPTADAALMAATAMQNSETDRTVSFRAGFHVGPVIRVRRDIFGDAVNVAARIASLAKAGEILFTGEAKEQLSPALRAGSSFLDRTTVKGKREPVDIFGLAVLEGEGTLLSRAQPSSGTEGCRLALSYRDREVGIDEQSGRFSIGRDAGCDLVVGGDYASRQHAVVEFKRGKFYLVDQSTNGTYVLFHEHDPVFLKREMLQLLGKGSISLGRDPGQDQADMIRFHCKS